MADVAQNVFTAGARPAGATRRSESSRRPIIRACWIRWGRRAKPDWGGRFVNLIATPSLAGTLINLRKRNTFVWCRRVDGKIRDRGPDYTIIRVGFLLDQPGGEHAIVPRQDALPLSPRNRIAGPMSRQRSSKPWSIRAPRGRRSRSFEARGRGGNPECPARPAQTRSSMIAAGAYLFGGRNGAPVGIRTPNLLIRSQVLYPVELREHCRGPALRPRQAARRGN